MFYAENYDTTAHNIVHSSNMDMYPQTNGFMSRTLQSNSN